MFLKADGSGRSLFCLCGSYSDAGSVTASGCCCSAELGMTCGCRFPVPLLFHGTSVTAAGGLSRGEDVDKVTQGDGRESVRRPRLNWLMRYLYPGRGRTAASGSQLMGDPGWGGNL